MTKFDWAVWWVVSWLASVLLAFWLSTHAHMGFVVWLFAPVWTIASAGALLTLAIVNRGRSWAYAPVKWCGWLAAAFGLARLASGAIEKL